MSFHFGKAEGKIFFYLITSIKYVFNYLERSVLFLKVKKLIHTYAHTLLSLTYNHDAIVEEILKIIDEKRIFLIV